MTIPSSEVERMLPLYEAKMVAAYDHRAADVVKSPTAPKRQNQPQYLDVAERRDFTRTALPMSWVREELVPQRPWPSWLAFLRISSPTNHRTFIASLLPRAAVGDSLFLLEGTSPESECLLLAQINSFAMDYLARQKVAGLNLNFFYVRQLPFLTPSTFDSLTPWHGATRLATWFISRVMRLQHTNYELLDVAERLGWSAPVRWEDSERSRILADMDAAMFHLYGIERDDVDYIMETFPIVKRKDIASHGEYRTKTMILDIYDQMAEAIAGGPAYASPFDQEAGDAG